MCKDHEFRINHKPKKVKEICYGQHIYSNLKVKGNVLTLDHCKYYGSNQLVKGNVKRACPIESLVELHRQAKDNEEQMAFDQVKKIIEF